MQENAPVSKGMILYSTYLKSTQDAAHEALLRGFERIDVEDVARLEAAKFASALKVQLPDEAMKFITDIYTDQWSETYSYLREKLVKLSQIKS